MTTTWRKWAIESISARPGATAWIIYTPCRDTCECGFLNLIIINQVWPGIGDCGFRIFKPIVIWFYFFQSEIQNPK
jgi:hypothetical protein